jgi:hypothetical protein
VDPGRARIHRPDQLSGMAPKPLPESPKPLPQSLVPGLLRAGRRELHVSEWSS